MVNRPTNHRTDVNRSAILAHLGASGPASRAELARVLDVSPALMTQLTKDLLTERLLVELEQAPSSGGRPARMLGLAASAGRAVGVKVTADHVAFVEVGLDGRVLRSASEPFDALPSTYLADLVTRIRHFLSGGGNAPLLGIGVGVPGAVDQPGRGIVTAPQLGWNAVPLGESLRGALDLPVIVENNVNALTVAERLYGMGRGRDNFLVVTIGTGVGAGMVVEGAVVRGRAGGVGEIGHMPVLEDGPRCRCGNDGCLEAYIGEEALVDAAREPASSAPARASTPCARPPTRATRRRGDLRSRRPPARAHARRRRAHVDPALVIVLGEGTAAWGHWSFGFEPAFRSHLMPHRRGISRRDRDLAGRELGAGCRGARARDAVRRRGVGRPGPAHPRAARREAGRS